ncbi:class I SAM-dependent methyltransferase [Haloparvum sp. PAK95]|uniref:class I SAM-dependent methyltransferase n=1 Tax=Haloparvum sp. PAK95 TaxID=3418962 RepID=UPI003D2EE3C4
MRRFSAEYLERTRRGMWADSRAALADLDLAAHDRILDVGCGTGELTRVLAEEAHPDATVVGVDADPELLAVAREEATVDEGAAPGEGASPGEEGTPDEGPAERSFLAGDATRLPFPDDAFDLVVCQALLINLPEPRVAVAEFARVAADRVAAIEPNNAEVAVSSTVEAEEGLEREAREAFLAGVGTDVALGRRVQELFDEVGLGDVSTDRYHHRKRVEAPYTEAAMEDAARKASGAGIASHRAELESALSETEYDELRRRWREMGRAVVEQMQSGEYERIEIVPFDVTVGRV